MRKFLRGKVPIGIAAAAGLAAGWLLSSLASRPPRPEPPATEQAAGIYTCSMHPQVRSSRPDDRCPICGMELIPVPREEHGEPDDLPGLRLSPRAAALMQVEVRPVERRELQVPVRLFGRVAHDERRLRTIAAWAPGRLDLLHVDFTGQAVQEGEPMAELFSPVLIAAQEELLQALQAARKAQGSVEQDRNRLTANAARERLRLLGVADSQIARVEASGRVEDRVVLPAPSGGVVIERLASQGDFVETGQAILKLADLEQLWILLEAHETDLPWLKMGQKARFSARSLPGEHFEGTVAFIDPVIEERTRTARVRVEIHNPEGRLKPGMFGHGVVLAEAAGQLCIPDSAPLLTGKRAVVYVQMPGTERPTYEPRQVVLGARAGPWRVVLEGLAEGELVVMRGGFKIDSELQIRGRPSMMQPQVEATSPEPFRAGLSSLVEANLELVGALADDDPLASVEAALRAQNALNEIDPSGLDDPVSRRTWADLFRRLGNALEALAAADALEPQRRHFETFSDALIEALRFFGVGRAEGPLYRAVCPMVQGREASWLQGDPTISNPYHGASMLRCGEIVETLTAPGRGPR